MTHDPRRIEEWCSEFVALCERDLEAWKDSKDYAICKQHLQVMHAVREYFKVKDSDPLVKHLEVTEAKLRALVPDKEEG